MARWAAYEGEDKLSPPPLRCECKGGTRCVLSDVEHVWPAHELSQLHSTRVETMFSSDHYPLLADLFFLPPTAPAPVSSTLRAPRAP